MSLLLPGGGEEFTAIITETIAHRDALVVREIGQATVDAALEQQQLELDLMERLTDEEREAIMRLHLTPKVDPSITNAREQYGAAQEQASERIKELFGVMGGYRFGSVFPGELILDGESTSRTVMTELSITAQQGDVRVDKKQTAIEIDETTGASHIDRSSLRASFNEVILVSRAIARMRDVNRALWEAK